MDAAWTQCGAAATARGNASRMRLAPVTRRNHEWTGKEDAMLKSVRRLVVFSFLAALVWQPAGVANGAPNR